ncbi:MAG: hypothetical protein CVT88_00585 [Candidatus Altiarchaeales archaeon HGW-Altiarchaeales-1]|nr:MAG: hypothetical protein CVT88_00585 [Candidatus Altiarchaeales archaeon HGW-Altiarchaeales-1]
MEEERKEMKTDKLSRLQFSSQITNNIENSFAITTIIQGRITKIKGANVTVKTHAGESYLSFNASSEIKKLVKIDNQGFHYEKISHYDLINHICIFKIVIYNSPADIKPRHHTILRLVSFGINNELVKNPYFHCVSADWLASFWLPTMDIEFGGVYGNILNGGVQIMGPDRDDKWSYLTSRSLAGFSFGFQLTGKSEYLNAAIHTLEFLKKSKDEIKGNIIFRSRQLRNGNHHQLASSLYNIFVHEYCLTGLLRYYAATSDNETYNFIIKALESLMLFYDSKYGGFYDAIDRNTLLPIPKVTDTKSFTSSADVLAATVIFAKELNIHTNKFNPTSVAIEICKLIVDHHLIEDNPFIIESFNSDWTLNTSPWRNEYATADLAGSCGATAKVARVLAVCLPFLPRELQNKTKQAIKNILDNLIIVGAWDPLRGGVHDFMIRYWKRNQLGEFVFHSDYVWWSQEQLCVTAYLGYLLFNDNHYLDIARSIVNFWLGCFISIHGGVHDTIDHVGNPVSAQMGCWLKNSYHELEFAYYIAIFEAIINKTSITLYFAPSYTGNYFESLPDIGIIKWDIVENITLPNGTKSVTFKPIKL